MHRGCCWDTTVPGIPRCFHRVPRSTTTTTTPKRTNAELSEPSCNVGHPREDCGFPGVKEYTCRAKGCCWDSSVHGVPWCFHRVPRSTTTTTTPKTTDTELPEPSCNLGHPREDCGFPGIKEYTCRAKGCCWDSSVHGVPWCFHGVRATMLTITTSESQLGCDVGDPSYRMDCGYPGIHPDVCHQRNCCWDTSIPDVPWCYFRRGVTTREPQLLNCDDVDPSERVDCGYPGIHPHVCRQRDCCWDSSIPNVPWCFRGVSVTTVKPAANTVIRPQTSQCRERPKSRKRCGQHDINREQCINEGCCWRVSRLYGVPSCYYAVTNDYYAKLLRHQNTGQSIAKSTLRADIITSAL